MSTSLSLSRWLGLQGFWSKRIAFYRDLARAIDHKELLTQFIDEEWRIARHPDTRDRSRAYALQEMRVRARRGGDVSIAHVIGGSMPATDRLLLSALTLVKDGQQAMVLRTLAEALSVQARAKKEWVSALLVPAVLLPAVSANAWVISARLIPAVEKSAPASIWTPFNAMVRALAHAIDRHGLVFLCLALLVATLGWVAMPRWVSPLRTRMEAIAPGLALCLSPVAPWLLPLSLYRDTQALMLLSSLAVALSSGKTLTDALVTVRKGATPYLAHHIMRIVKRLERNPSQVASSFAGGVLSPLIMARLGSLARVEPNYHTVLTQVGLEGADMLIEAVAQQAKRLKNGLMALCAALLLVLYVGQVLIVNDMREALESRPTVSAAPG